MGKEISPQNKIKFEIAQKRELLEETLTIKMLREMPSKTPLKKDGVAFRIDQPYAFQELVVMKIVGNQAEVVPYDELRRSKPISMLSFNVSELWDEEDYFSIRDEIDQMNSAQIIAKISQPNLTN